MKHPHLAYPGDDPAEKKVGRPKKRGRDPVREAVQDSSDLTSILRRIAQGVNYSEFLTAGEGDDILAANVFLELRGLGVIDVFVEMEDGEKAAKIGVPPSRLEILRAHPSYQKMCGLLKEAARRLLAPSTIDKMAEAGERELAQSLFQMAMGAKSDREKLKAITELGDRRSAKKPRDPARGREMIFPDGLTEFMKLALEMGRAHEQRAISAGHPTIEISAARLNVPVVEEEG